MSKELRVGRVGKDVFIGITGDAYEPATLPLSGETIHNLRFPPSDIPWIIKALQKELRLEARKANQ